MDPQIPLQQFTILPLLLRLQQRAQPGFDICVAPSPNMCDDTWTDHGSVGVLPAPGAHTYTTIDQNLVTGESNPYAQDAFHSLVWGSFNAALYGMTLSPSNPLKMSASQEPQVLIRDQSVAVPDPNSFQYKNQTAPSPVGITMYYGHNHLKFDGQGWPFLSAMP